ncbi:MAG TPA: acetylglutamate kinase [Bryobacteraceae bacterium]|nr:acetylglutamate kinase [Bryobacteraceae bacterium]
MKILIKLGGTLLDGEASRQTVAVQLAAARQAHPQTVVVHGGGKQMTRFLAERNVESKFVEGLRVTSEEVLDAVLKVFAGSVNHQLVASLVAAGAPAVGITGIDACLAEAEQLRPELGFVGKPVRSNPALLHTLLGGGFLPVVACVAGDRKGQIYNVNADQMAVSCASGFQADRLLFLTDVDGVKDGGGQVIPVLTLEQSRLLITDGIATGGMQAKLNAAADALLGGVGEVVIAPGAAPDIIARLLSGEPVGTRFVRS